MIDFVVDYISYAIRYGLSWVTLVLAVLALLKSRKLRRRFNKYLPPIFRDEQDSEIGKYIQNQKKIESKVDYLIYLLFAICTHFLIPVKRWEECGSTETSSNTEARNSRRLSLLLRMVKNQKSRRVKKMKLYLAKLGSRKFQAYLAVTIPNLIILFGFIFGGIDLEGTVNQWMPAINLAIQALVTKIYSSANVSAIKAREGNTDAQLNIPIEPPI